MASEREVVHLKKSLPKNGLQARKEKGFTVFGTPKQHQGKSIGPQKSWTSRRERRGDDSRGIAAGDRKGDSFFRKNDIQTDEFREARYGCKSDCNKWTGRGLPEKREMASGEASEAEKRRHKFPVDETGKIV